MEKQKGVIMVMLDHLQKFIAENPDRFGKTGADILGRAWASAGPDGNEPIVSGEIGELLGAHSMKFFSLMMSDPEYIKISMEAIQNIQGKEENITRNMQATPVHSPYFGLGSDPLEH